MEHTVTNKVMKWRHTDSPESGAEAAGYGKRAEGIQQNYVNTYLYSDKNNC
jgi:hypothetical protein